MKIFTFLFFIPLITPFKYSGLKKISITSLYNSPQNNKVPIYIKTKQKISSYKKLIRSQNIIPTSCLFLTGGILTNPNFYSKKFVFSLISTLLILSAGMILNDLFDIPIDKINNPTRPLITGEIKISEAIGLVTILLSLVEYINIYVLQRKFDNIITLSIIHIFTYTPILKKIFFIKNISCASIVTFSIFYGAIASTNTILQSSKNYPLLSVTMTLVFLGSLYNEILLDISDYEGDKKNKLSTLPTLFGKDVALYITKNILQLNVFGLFMETLYLYNNIFYSTLFLLLCTPLFIDLYNIKKNNYKKETILDAVTISSRQLLFLLILIIYIGYK